MKNNIRFLLILTLFTVTGLVLSSFSNGGNPAEKNMRLPYKKAGLTERQAAAHLLSRFTFGAKPGQVDQVVAMGLEKWLVQQLNADLPNENLEKRLSEYNTLKMTNAQIEAKFPKGGEVLKMAIKDGVIDRDAVNKEDARKKEYRDKLQAYMTQKGMQPQAELYRQLINQKILRAAYSENQLQELLASFWFNHFNVSLTKNDCANFVTAYERDVIRPNVLNKFETLLMATAKSPAMLTYLDNFKSSAPDQTITVAQKMRQQKVMQQLQNRQNADSSMQMDMMEKIKKVRASSGLNENYAREIMELHTLGVDGGYTQSDVTQAARVLTGWTVMPMGKYADNSPAVKFVRQGGKDKLDKLGIVQEGDFVFAPQKHDKGEKVVLGTKFEAGGGYEEGAKLIKILAHHKATAKFIATKLAVRFVNDKPSPALVDKMAKTFLEKDGDIRQVLITMVSSPEFWSKEALREKTKSPFELAISSVRSLDANIQAPYQLFTWITKMGERMYYYQAPTGFPDRGQYWINTGSLLNRMNFGLALASQRIPGITINLAALNQNKEPESAEAALVTYSKYLMPERNLDETIKRLTPSLNDPNYAKKISDAAEKTAPATEPNMMAEPKEDMMLVTNTGGQDKRLREKPGKKGNGKGNYTSMQMQSEKGNNSMLAQVVGVIIGSPEFQRR